jgi:hypothetical protein
MRRAVIGFLVAPVVGVAVSTLAVLPSEFYGLWWVYLLVGSAIAYLSALVFGLPAYLLMKRVMRLQWWQVIVAGALCGLPFWLVSEYPYTTAYFRNQGMTNLALYVASGAIAGLVFWLITRGAAPSNSTPHTDARASSVLHEPPSARAGERGR